MDQFDQTIKDKINSASYDYQPQAWRSFKRSSGMPTLSVGAKLAIGSAAVAVVGGTLFFTLHENDNRYGQENNPIQTVNQQVPETENILQDTVLIANNSVEETDNSQTVNVKPVSTSTAKSSSPQTAQRPAATPQTSITDEAPAQTTTPTHTQVRPAAKPNTYYGRPLEILVDTISSIDFPDYKAKPADMLP